MRRAICGLVVMFVVAIGGQAQATLTFSGTGTGIGGAVGAKAEFDFESHDFGSGGVDAIKIALTNTSAITTDPADLLTGVFFSFSTELGNLSTTAAGFDGSATVVTGSPGPGGKPTAAPYSSSVKDIAPALDSTATDGGYALTNGPFTTSSGGSNLSAYRYGISTVGATLTGLNGDDLGPPADNYGIFAGPSDYTNPPLQSMLPLIDTVAYFWIAKPTGLTNLNQITSVGFTFGSDAFLRITTTNTNGGGQGGGDVVPEP
ncbi:MAG TPA: XDD4 family exosortase-dependent surface protein, partial [Planctomycetaceae bacterium]|nr:XDD4 family exosortase-dependent surface protein [Planctomycetaceae bacterium]